MDAERPSGEGNRVMPNPALGGILRAVCRAAENLQLTGLPDPDLLRRFTDGRDEANRRSLVPSIRSKATVTSAGCPRS